MAEVAEHPDEDVLIDLVLGGASLTFEQRDNVADHLGRCLRCRRAYDELASSVELVLPAVPRAAPPADFESQVLTRLGVSSQHSDEAPTGQNPPSHRGSWWRRPVLAAAAAAVLGVAAGAGVTGWLTSEDEAPVAVREAVVELHTSAGDRVGTVARSFADSGQVLVVDVDSGSAPDGKEYSCRLVLADGQEEIVASWTISSERPNSWVIELPEEQVARVELVARSGTVWSTAELAPTRG